MSREKASESGERGRVASVSGNAQEHVLAKLLVRAGLLTFVAGAVAAGYSLTLDNQYRAGSALLLSPPPINQPEVRERSVNPDTAPASTISFLMTKPLSVPVYELLLENDEVAQKLRTKLAALASQAGEDVPKPLLEDVRRAMEVSTRIVSRTSREVAYDPVIGLLFTHTSPKIAAEMANEWARLGIELGEQLSEKGKEGSIEFIEGRFGDIAEKLDTKEKEIEALESQWDLEAMRAGLQQTQALITEYELDEARLSTDIARTQGELDELLKALASVPAKLTLHKAPPDEAYWLMDEGQQASDTAKVLETEEINWLHVTLSENAAMLQSTLTGLVQQKDMVAKQLAELRPRVLGMQRNLAEQSRIRAALERESETYKDQYRRLAVNYEGARIAEAEITPDLKLAYSAAVPEKKVGPHRSLIVLAAALLGALVAPLHFLLLASLRTYSGYLGARLNEGAKSGAP